MIDEKKKFEFPKSGFSTVEVGNSSISVKKYLAMSEEDNLIGIYVAELFSETNYKSVSRAENALIASVLETCTNILLVEDNTVVTTLDMIFENFEVWEQIISKIKNYSEFRKRLDATVEMLREEKRLNASIGKVIDDTYTKLSGFIENLLANDFSPEKIEGIKSLLSEVNSSPILKDSVELFKNQNKNKSEKLAE